MLEKARQFDDNVTTLEMLSGSYAAAGHPDKPTAVAAELAERSKHRYVCPYEIATIYAAVPAPKRRHPTMKGKPEVLAVLSDMLKEELTAINQYILHAEMCENWGYKRLANATKKESIGEMKHAEHLIERMLFLEGSPKMQEMGKLNIGKDVPQQLKNDLALEKGAVTSYNRAIETCRKAGDNATADFLKEILKDEEEHVDRLETQLGLIEQLGLQNYLSQQLEDEEED